MITCICGVMCICILHVCKHTCACVYVHNMCVCVHPGTNLHGISIYDDSNSFARVLSIIFPKSDKKLKMKLSDEVEDKHDRNKDSTLQLDEFATFMWDLSLIHI